MDVPRDKIHITNLPAAASHTKIFQLFKKFGLITKVFIQRQGATWNCDGQAYVAYEDAESATKAVDEMNGEMLEEAIMSVELISDSEYLLHVKTMPNVSMLDGQTKPLKKQKKVPAPTKLTPKDIALAPNSQWEPYISPCSAQYGAVSPGATANIDSQEWTAEAASSKGATHQVSKYHRQDRSGKSSLHNTYKSAHRSSAPNRSRSLRGPLRSLVDDLYRDPLHQDPPHEMSASDLLTRRLLRGERRSVEDDRYRDPAHQDQPRTSRADRHSDHSRDRKSDPVPPRRSLPLRRDHEDDPYLDSKRRRHDRYDAPRSRDYEYERLPETSHRERSPSRRQGEREPLPSSSKLRVYGDDHEEERRAPLNDTDPPRRDPYRRDPYPCDDRRDLDRREERLYREPVRDGYRELRRVDDRYSIELDRADPKGYDDRGHPNDRLYRQPERASSQDSRTLGVDRPTYDYSLESTLGADRPTYDYSL